MHDSLMEGAWKVERQDGPAPAKRGAAWDKLYLEKGSFGSVRLAGVVGVGRLHFKTDIDEEAHTVRLLDISGTEAVSHELSASYVLADKKLHLEGQYKGGPFSLDLVRELPR